MIGHPEDCGCWWCDEPAMQRPTSAQVEERVSSILTRLCTHSLEMHDRVAMNMELSTAIELLIETKIRETLFFQVRPRIDKM